MPKILRVELTSDQKREVRERLRARDLAPGTGLRLDCIRLMGRGLTVPEVADLLECNDVTVRGAVHRFAAGVASQGVTTHGGDQDRHGSGDDA
ncbi:MULTISPECIES: hypothetical protein [unclassified Streptomyces]|uniref:hypothetical protein n=1 Tax=unclassified Streptomyces TaxID=2593676 RepID=UPI002DDC154E|nr:hypothetical protein [Streptomyces sp. NBC_01750]WSB04939.1 hypothetical protein OIE54_40395 [Streptomyces sp. NBC_01794]WSD30786.1 hypothetical protein OG966_01725 [Streptomyces sp. NBC_01750]